MSSRLPINLLSGFLHQLGVVLPVIGMAAVAELAAVDAHRRRRARCASLAPCGASGALTPR